jgi:hypothetical protein
MCVVVRYRHTKLQKIAELQPARGELLTISLPTVHR